MTEAAVQLRNVARMTWVKDRHPPADVHAEHEARYLDRLRREGKLDDIERVWDAVESGQNPLEAPVDSGTYVKRERGRDTSSR